MWRIIKAHVFVIGSVYQMKYIESVLLYLLRDSMYLLMFERNEA